MKKITVAIDGHSSCGKSTMAKELARKLGYVYVDTGAMYRAVTLFALRNKLMDPETKEINEEELKAVMPEVQITQSVNAEGKVETFLNGECVEGDPSDACKFMCKPNRCSWFRSHTACRLSAGDGRGRWHRDGWT